MTSPLSPQLSVVIPTRHRNDLLALCLERMAPETQQVAGYEVVVTDDGSDSTAEAMIRERFPFVRWVAGPRRGPAANRNNGASHATGEWLVFTDDDCLPDAGFLAAYLEAMRAHPTAQVFEGRTYADRPRRSLAEVSPLNEQGGYLWSCNFAIRRRLFEELEGFDRRYLSAAMEDVDLRERLRKGGHEFPFVPGAAVCHPWRIPPVTQGLKEYEEAVRVYLTIHPDHREKFGLKARFYMLMLGLTRVTLPGLIRFRGAGFRHAWHLHWHQFRAVLRELWPSAAPAREEVSKPR